MNKAFEDYLLANPYVPTRSFSQDEWEASMYEKWKDEQDNKELFTGGEWKVVEHGAGRVRLESGNTRIASLYQDATEEEMFANADLLQQAPAMYKELHKCLAFFEDSDYPERAEEIKSILNKANPKQ